MSPGREMDALVAEKVFGWKRIDEISYSEPLDNGLGLQRLLTEIPHYSTDIATAWEVVEKISETMWIQIYNCLRDPKSLHFQWCCEIEPDKYREAIEILADTAPHAICLAALKAVGVEI